MFWFLLFISLPLISIFGMLLYIIFKTRIFAMALALVTLIAVLIMGMFNGTSLFPSALIFGGGLFLVGMVLTTNFCKW